MTFDIRKSCIASLLAASLVTTAPMTASAQFLGGADPTDILTDILEQAEIIAAAAEQIVENGEFGNLAPLLPEIEQVLTLLEQAQTISFNVNNVIDEFNEIFPENFDAFDLAQTVASIDGVNATTRENIQRVLELGASAVQSQLPTAIRTESIRAVGAAAGPAAALQAMVQLQAEQIGQFSRLQTLLATQARVQGLKASEVETARKRAQRLRELDDPTSFIVENPADIELGLDLLN